MVAFYRGWRYAAFIGGFVGFIGIAIYPIIISPMLDPSEYSTSFCKIMQSTKVPTKNVFEKQEDLVRVPFGWGPVLFCLFCYATLFWLLLRGHLLLFPEKIQKETRKNIRQEDIQPGNMKVWTDPFDRKKPQSE